MKTNLMQGSAALALCCLMPLSTVAETTPPVDIAAQDMIDAIAQLGAASGRQIIGADEVLRGRTSTPVRGPMTPRQALVRMLADDSLLVEELTDGTLVVSARTRQPNIATQNADMDAYDLGTLVITASGFTQQIIDAPATITVIDGEDLADRPYDSVADVVRDVPGVIIGAASARSGGEEISIRGLGEDYVLILVDGKPVGNSQEATYNGYGSGLAKSKLPPASAIDQVEVIRGPMSSLYGSAASGGVINIITKPVTPDWSGSMTIGATTYDDPDMGDTREARFYLSGPLVEDRLGLALYGSLHDRHKPEMGYISRGGTGTQEQDRRDSTLGARLNWVVTDQHELSFEVTSSRNDTDQTLDTGSDSGIEVDSMSYALTHDFNWGDGYETTSFVSFEDVEFDDGTNTSGYEMLNFNSKTNLSLGAHDMTLGLDYRTEKTVHDQGRFLADPTDVNARPDAEMERWHWSLFGEDNYHLTEDLTLTFGLRYDNNENYGDKFTPRVYGVWHATPNLTIKGGVSGGYKVPTLKQADSNIFESAGGGSGTDQGNTDLKPEETVNYEIGAIWEATSGLQIGATAYHTQFRNGIDRDLVCDITAGDDCGLRPDGATNEWIQQYVNRDQAELTGVELTLDHTIGDVDVAFNYTWAESRITKGEGKGERFNTNPEHVVNLGLDWQANEALSAWTNVQFRSETLDEDDSKIEAHTLVDIGLNYQFNDVLSGTAAIYNVADKTFGATNYNDGRAFYIGLTSTF